MFPEYLDSQHTKVARPHLLSGSTGSWYSFVLEVESTPEP